MDAKELYEEETTLSKLVTIDNIWLRMVFYYQFVRFAGTMTGVCVSFHLWYSGTSCHPSFSFYYEYCLHWKFQLIDAMLCLGYYIEVLMFPQNMIYSAVLVFIPTCSNCSEKESVDFTWSFLISVVLHLRFCSFTGDLMQFSSVAFSSSCQISHC